MNPTRFGVLWHGSGAGDDIKQYVPLVPSTIRGLSQISALSFQDTMTKNATGKSRLAGNAARNWAIGCTTRVKRGFSPILMPMGSQMMLAMAMSTVTRSKVMKASPITCISSFHDVFSSRPEIICHDTPRNHRKQQYKPHRVEGNALPIGYAPSVRH